MAKVVIALSMSLDGFIAGPNDGSGQGLGSRGGHHLFDWYFSGSEHDPRYPMFKPEGSNRAVMERMFEQTGAMLTGRRTFDITDGWDGTHPVNAIPIILLTHKAPTNAPRGESPLFIVTDGLERAVEKAKEVAGEKSVGVVGAGVAQQCLKAGLVDEIWVSIAPMLLGDGVRLFDDGSRDSIRLEKLEAVDGRNATHIRYRVLGRNSHLEQQRQ
jgi:dihydrofolate reductase